MMNAKSLALVGLLCGFFSALASAETLNERVYETTLMADEDGQSQLLPGYQYGEMVFDSRGFDAKVPFQDYSLSYIYGINNNISIGAQGFWRHLNDDDDIKNGSLLDPEFFVRAKSSFNSDLTLFYSGTLSISPEKDKEDNQYTGGPALKGDIGLKRYLGSPNALVSYASFKLKAESERDAGDASETSEGGHELQLHGGYEHQIQNSRVGATLGALKFLKGKSEYKSVYGTQSYEKPEGDYLVGNLYGMVDLNERFTILPSFKYLRFLDSGDAEVELFSGSLSLIMGL